MLTLAALLLALAAALGIAAALLWLKRDAAPPARLAAAHATAALAGVGLFVPALFGAAHGAASGTQSFGIVTAALLGAAVLAGLALLMLRLKRRRYPGALVGAHATLAISGFVILAVYAILG
jgi:hypothetical protein